MRRLTYLVAVSADGFIAAPDGDASAFPVEGDHIDMLVTDLPETLPAPALAALGVQACNGRFDTVVMGWNTYAVGLDQGLADPYPHLRQVVFSRSRAAPAGTTASVTADDPVSVVRALKAQPDGAGIWLCGGAQLAGALWDEIDELFLKVNPVVLGRGIPLVDRPVADPRAFHLTASTAYRSGVVVDEYARTPATI